MGKVVKIDTKQKLNRWSFEVHAKGRVFAIPVVAFGPEARAQTIAAYVHADYSNLQAFKDLEFEVKQIRHESISEDTYNQINGLEIETKILGVALQDLAKDFVHVGNAEEVIGKAVAEARNKVAAMYGMNKTNIANEQEKAVAEVIATESDSPEEKIELGVDSLKAVLSGK